MASPNDEQAVEGAERNPHVSRSKWRHQESSAYLRHAAKQGEAREPTAATSTSTAPLANFLNSDRLEPTGPPPAHGNAQDIIVAAGHADEHAKAAQDHHADERVSNTDGRDIACGPLLNYRHTISGRWYGSVLIVIKGGGKEVIHQPTLELRRVGEARQLHQIEEKIGTGHHADSNGATDSPIRVEPHRLYSDKRNTFWAFDIDVAIEQKEVKYEYSIPDMRYLNQKKPQKNSFFIHAASESMRIMFHSCNGFSVGTDVDEWSGAALWNDVMRKHEHSPFHVMIGGGDQIYNDGIRVDGPLRPWTEIGNPRKRQECPFPEKLRSECDDYYLNNYIQWYNTDPFSLANGQIPQLNIWDDHDIIDGFGSYVDKFMRCDVFRGIGGTAHKYYMLFQHHLPPPPSTYTSDHAELEQGNQGIDPNQTIDTFVASTKSYDQYIIGKQPGPYVAEHSFNMYARLGARIAMMGIDARTERTRHQINYPETYDLIFARVRKELSTAASSEQPIKHLIILLGIPIAYPRLTWLENILKSPIIGPVKFLHKRFGVGGGLFNQFDGSVDLLDDLDDHYTAKTHKHERRQLIERLQSIAAEFSVRVTILGGDVHLAALGRFYSNPKLKIPVEQDSRYMANVVSSAIVNKPPPQAVANLLAKRNKIHHLNHDTDETLLDIFNKDPGDSNKTINSNHCTMPSRNYAMLTENSPHNSGQFANGTATNGESAGTTNGNGEKSFVGEDGHSFLHAGELKAGTTHKAALHEQHGAGNDCSLDIRINVEIDQHSREGRTESYGLTVPVLNHKQAAVAPAAAPNAAPISNGEHTSSH